MKRFLEIFGFIVFSSVVAVGGFIIYCILTDRQDLIHEMKERCGLHQCCCYDEDDDFYDDEFDDDDDDELEELLEDEDDFVD